MYISIYIYIYVESGCVCVCACTQNPFADNPFILVVENFAETCCREEADSAEFRAFS